MFKKTARLLLVTALMISMIAPATVLASVGTVVDIDATEHDVTESVNEDVHAEGEYQDAVDVSADNGFSADVTTKNVESEDGAGIFVEASDSSRASVTVNGNATGLASFGVGAGVSSSDDATAYLSVTGNATGKMAGAWVTAENGSSASFEAGNAVGSGEYSTGLYVYEKENDNPGNDKKAASVSAVISNDAIGARRGVSVDNDGGFADVIVGGDALALSDDNYDYLAGVRAHTDNNGFSDICIVGNAQSGDIGIIAVAENGGINNIVVEGTVYGGEAGLRSAEDNDGQNIISVWKIETDKDGMIAGDYDDDYNLVEDEEAEKNIRYIIKVDQPEGATLKATDENGNALATVDAANGKSYDYAFQGDKVLLKIDVNEGYSLDAVYGDDGKQYALGKDASGNYYILVPAGGGVKFSAVLSWKGIDKDDDDNKKEEAPVVVNIAQNASVLSDAAVAAAVASAAAQAATATISNTSSGGTANIALSSPKVDATVVRTLLARRDINVSLACFVNGKLCTIMIPAGADLSDIINPDGTIDIEKLAKKFGKTEVQ